MPRGQELGVHLGTTHRGEQALALRNDESTFPQTQVLALRIRTIHRDLLRNWGAMQRDHSLLCVVLCRAARGFVSEFTMP